MLTGEGNLHRRRSPAALNSKKTLFVRFEGRDNEVSWYPGASDASISRGVDLALQIPTGTGVIVRDPQDGSVLAISDSLPDRLHVNAERTVVQERVQSIVGGGKPVGDGLGSAAREERHDGEGKEFRGELLKFERINAHLANERTWLAWVRTALSVLTMALSLLSLTDDLSSSIKILGVLLGVAFVVCTLFTYFTGWLRYSRVKEVLAWRGTQVKAKLGRFGLSYQARFLGIALACAVPLYVFGGVNVITS
ncbi:unnamed protein product [Choristocarpus tenellus]